MSGELQRPARLPGDIKLIRELIAAYETWAATATDAELEAAREKARELSLGKFPAIAEAVRNYQTPSQAFYVFDRVINHRALARLHPAD